MRGIYHHMIAIRADDDAELSELALRYIRSFQKVNE